MSSPEDKMENIFLDNLKHEIRTQLTAILGYSELLLDNRQSESDRINSINTIIRSGRQLQEIVNNISDIRQNEDQKNEVDLKKIVKEIIYPGLYSNIVSGRILLAEDNQDNQELVSLYIRTAGAEVDVANNGQQAVEMAKQHNYDLILLDMKMPVMSGLEAAALLNEQACKSPIVALTANAFEDMAEDCINAGCRGFLTKPIDRSRFYQVLRKYLAASPDKIIPLRSSLLDDEPELLDLIKKYTAKYPSMIQDLKKTFEYTDGSEFEMLLHDIKSTGGNYGFMLITDLAVMIKTHLNNHNRIAIVPLLDELESLHKRMLLAFE
ncbi:MAG: hypothetical protein DIZ80_14935 [endosymbiont of Galathealinum brachiosum]|uniref:histidine kinase n=1 Tax=endosymbiont of Galathealinum brachiosum TaxID=2200906 RepID=A0A370D916_9GAMM|nr:MAG: hypothetical protein DIZ80_14935 [endosymbiont of Galathealinum brachiosum]